MQLQPLDWFVAILCVLVCFVPGLFFGRRAGKSTSEFFASGRSVPWWLAGLSMVATTFSSDTPEPASPTSSAATAWRATGCGGRSC